MCGRFGAQESEETIMRHTWNLFAQAGSIWVAWIKENLLRVRSFWIIKISQKCSLGWRKLLKLRELTRQFIRSVGDGKKYFLVARLVAS
jgi:hypothetical protein